MNVALMSRQTQHGMLYQIMQYDGRSGFTHVAPGRFFTEKNALIYCHEHNHNVVAIGDMWECLHAKKWR